MQNIQQDFKTLDKMITSFERRTEKGSVDKQVINKYQNKLDRLADKYQNDESVGPRRFMLYELQAELFGANGNDLDAVTCLRKAAALMGPEDTFVSTAAQRWAQDFYRVNNNQRQDTHDALYNLRPYAILLSAISIILLVVAVTDRAYGYYQFLRFFITAAAVTTCYVAYRYKVVAITIISGILAVLFNPFAPIHLEKRTWQIIDGFAAIYFMILFVILWFSRGNGRLVTRKAIAWVIAILILLMLLTGGGIISDYRNYKAGNWSHLFGTLDTYQQNQVLKFKPLEVRVTEVERKDYTPVDLITCASLPHKPPQNVGQTFWPQANEPEQWQEDCFGYGQTKNVYSNLYEHDKTTTRTNLVIHYFYKNTSNKTGNISNYEFYLEPSEQITDSEFAQEYPQDEAKPGVDNYANFNIDFPKEYNGSIWLVVRKDGVAKKIELSVPASNSTTKQSQ